VAWRWRSRSVIIGGRARRGGVASIWRALPADQQVCYLTTLPMFLSSFWFRMNQLVRTSASHARDIAVGVASHEQHIYASSCIADAGTTASFEFHPAACLRARTPHSF
jgi:hypothetical protein